MIEAIAGPARRRWRGAAQDRPALLTVVLCSGVLATATAHAVVALVQPDGTGLLFGLSAVLPALLVVAALWSVLPWRPQGPRWPTAAFLVAAVVLVVVDGIGVSSPVLLLALANVGLRQRTAVAVAVATAVVGALVVAMVVIYQRGPVTVVLQHAGIALVAGFVVAISTATRHARRAHEEADRLSGELEEANRALRLHADRAHEVAAAEERTRMARDLHDSIGHHLTVIKVELENAERYRHRDPEVAWAEVRQAKAVTVGALGEVRRWVRAMRPPLLDGQRGSAALHALARSFDGTGVTVDVAVEGDERPLDEAREVVLFRALQEAMTNAMRHSGARRVRARLAFEADAVSLAVVDDGRGSAGAPRAFGLTSLADRAGAVGGVLDSGDAPGGGFAVTLRLPDAA